MSFVANSGPFTATSWGPLPAKVKLDQKSSETNPEGCCMGHFQLLTASQFGGAGHFRPFLSCFGPYRGHRSRFCNKALESTGTNVGQCFLSFWDISG